MTRKSCAVGMRNAILRNYLNTLLEKSNSLIICAIFSSMYLLNLESAVKQFPSNSCFAGTCTCMPQHSVKNYFVRKEIKSVRSQLKRPKFLTTEFFFANE